MIDEHVLIMPTKEIASSISNILSISAEEIIELSLDSILPSKSKKLTDDISGSSRLDLTQSSTTMENYLRELSVYLLRISYDGSGTESELMYFFLLKNVLSSYVTIISENIPKTLDILDRSEFSFIVEREKIVRIIFIRLEECHVYTF